MKKDREDGRLQFHRPSQLFLIRLWAGEQGGEGEASEDVAQWYGKLQQVVTGETYYFHSSSELIETLLQMMRGMAGARPGP